LFVAARARPQRPDAELLEHVTMIVRRGPLFRRRRLRTDLPGLLPRACGLEIPQALVAPCRRIRRLSFEPPEDGPVPFVVDFSREPDPPRLESTRLFGAARVGVNQFVPERAPGCHPVGPRQAVEPEEQFVRRRRRVVPPLAKRRLVLIDEATPLPRAIDADGAGVRMVVGGCRPVLAARIGVLR